MKTYIENRQIVIPGQVLAEGLKYKPGFGTFREKSKIIASMIGLVEIRGQTYVQVVPFAGPYIPKIGDIVIGKVINTSIVSWKVEIGSPYIATLHASNVLDRVFNPLKDDIRKYFNIGDTLIGEVIAFNRTRDPVISIRGRKEFGKLRGGKIFEILPAKVPRLIGRKGSMINLIKDAIPCQILIGQNGRVWVKVRRPNDERLIYKIIKKIEKEAHTTGLTDRIKELIREERALQKQKNKKENESKSGDNNGSI
ncbi:MAG: exosome complex RNA-binding protein Rrp4 [Candidatus Helarchaeales archaeon]